MNWERHVAFETSEPAHTFILLQPVTPPNPTQTVPLGARLIQGLKGLKVLVPETLQTFPLKKLELLVSSSLYA